MEDLASLQISVETSEIKKGVDELDKLAAAAKRAEENAKGLEKSFGSMSSLQGDLFGGARSSLDRLKDSVKGYHEAVSAAEKAQGGLSGTVSALIGGFAQLAAAYISVKAVVGFLKDSAAEFMQTEAALNRLTVAMKNQKSYSEASMQSMRAFATEIQNTTATSDNAAISIMALMKNYGMSDAAAKKATQAALDFAAGNAALGMSAERAAQLIGRSYMGITQGMSRYGISVGEAKGATEKFKAVMDQIGEKFGGSAASELNTYAGQLKQLGNEWSTLKSTVGEMVMAVAGQFIPTMRSWIETLQEVADWMKKAFGVGEVQSGAVPDILKQRAAQLKEQIAQQKAISSTWGGGKGGDSDSVKQLEALLAKIEARIEQFNTSEASKLALQWKDPKDSMPSMEVLTSAQQKVYENLSMQAKKYSLSDYEYKKALLEKELQDTIVANQNKSKIVDKATELHQKKLKELNDTMSAQSKDMIKKQGWEDYAAGLNDAGDALREFNQVQAEAASYAASLNDAVKKSQELIKNYGWEDYAAGLDNVNYNVRALTQLQAKTWSEGTKEADKAAKDMERIWDQAMRNVQDLWGDLFSDLFSGNLKDWEDYGQAILKIMTDTLAQIAAAYMNQKIVIPAMEWLGLTGAQGGGGGGGATGAVGAGIKVAGEIVGGGGESGTQSLFGGLASLITSVGSALGIGGADTSQAVAEGVESGMSAVMDDSGFGDLDAAAYSLFESADTLADAGGSLVGMVETSTSGQGAANAGAALSMLGMGVGMINPLAGLAIGIVGGILSGSQAKITKEIVDSGIIAEWTNEALAGQGYITTKSTKTKAGFMGIGGGTKTSYSTETSALTQAQSAMLDKYTTEFSMYMSRISSAIGGSVDILEGVSVAAQKISTAGLDQTQIDAAFKGYLSRVTERGLKQMVGTWYSMTEPSLVSPTGQVIPSYVSGSEIMGLPPGESKFTGTIPTLPQQQGWEALPPLLIDMIERWQTGTIVGGDVQQHEQPGGTWAYTPSYKKPDTEGGLWQKYTPEELDAAIGRMRQEAEALGETIDEVLIRDIMAAVDKISWGTADALKDVDFIVGFRDQLEIFNNTASEAAVTIKNQAVAEVDNLIKKIQEFQTTTSRLGLDLDAANESLQNYVITLLEGDQLVLTESQKNEKLVRARVEEYERVIDLMFPSTPISPVTKEHIYPTGATPEDLALLKAQNDAYDVAMGKLAKYSEEQLKFVAAQAKWVDEGFKDWQKKMGGMSEAEIIMEKLGWTSEEAAAAIKDLIDPLKTSKEAFSDWAEQNGLDSQSAMTALEAVNSWLNQTAESADVLSAALQKQFEAWQMSIRGMSDLDIALKQQGNMSVGAALALVEEMTSPNTTYAQFKAEGERREFKTPDEFKAFIETISGAGDIIKDATEQVNEALDITEPNKYEGLANTKDNVLSLFAGLTDSLKAGTISTTDYMESVTDLIDAYEAAKDSTDELASAFKEWMDEMRGVTDFERALASTGGKIKNVGEAITLLNQVLDPGTTYEGFKALAASYEMEEDAFMSLLQTFKGAADVIADAQSRIADVTGFKQEGYTGPYTDLATSADAVNGELARLTSLFWDGSISAKQYSDAVYDLAGAYEANQAAAQAAADERKNLEDQLFELNATDFQKKAKLLDSLKSDEARETQKLIWAAEERIAVEDEAATLQERYNELMSTTTELKEKEIAGYDVANQALAKTVQTLESFGGLSGLKDIFEGFYTGDEKTALEGRKDADELLGNINAVLNNLDLLKQAMGDQSLTYADAKNTVTDYVQELLFGTEKASNWSNTLASARARLEAFIPALAAVGITADQAAMKIDNYINAMQESYAKQLQAWQMQMRGASEAEIIFKQYPALAADMASAASRVQWALNATTGEFSALASSLGITEDALMQLIATLDSAVKEAQQASADSSFGGSLVPQVSLPSVGGGGGGGGDTSALDEATQQLEDRFNSLSEALKNVQDIIDSLTVGEYAPVQSREAVQRKYDKLLDAVKAATEAEKPAAVQELQAYIPEYMKFMQSFGGNYRLVVEDVLADMQGLELDLTEQLDTLDYIRQDTSEIVEQLKMIWAAWQNYASTAQSMMSMFSKNVISSIPAPQSITNLTPTVPSVIGGLSHWPTVNAPSVAGAYPAFSPTLPSPFLSNPFAPTITNIGGSGPPSAMPGAGVTPQGSAWNSVPPFQHGGWHRGGMRIVGEGGPELEFTGASRILSNEDTVSMIAGAVREAVGGAGPGPMTIIVKIGEREVREIVAEVIPGAIKTDTDVQHQIRRVAR